MIVGRNNSGKTSLTDVFDRFAGEAGPRFRLEDFSAGIRAKFIAAKALRKDGKAPEVVLAALPKIAITLTFSYEASAPDLGPLTPFIIDLDASCCCGKGCLGAFAAVLSRLSEDDPHLGTFRMDHGVAAMSARASALHLSDSGRM